MLRALLGSILFVTSCVAHSSLYTDEPIPFWYTKKLVLYAICGFVLLALEGISGVLLFYGLDPIYHNVVFYVPLLALVTVINAEIIVKFSFKLNRHCFDAGVYSVVMLLLIYHTRAFAEKIVIAIAFIVTISTILTTLILWHYMKNLEKLVEYVDLKESAKVFTFASALLGSASIVLDFEAGRGDVFLIPPGVAFAVSLLLLAKEAYIKYLKPIRST